MTKIFKNLFVFISLDDIFIFSKEHWIHRLYVRAEKCEFRSSSVTYLGYILTPLWEYNLGSGDWRAKD